MTPFKVGDRVRVLRTPGTVFSAGKTGEVVWISLAQGGAASAVHLKLDGSLPGIFGEIRAVFGPHELELESPARGGESP